MKKLSFKLFLEEVAKADEADDIWFAGYAWLDLTERQVSRVATILDTKDFIRTTIVKDGVRYRLPSGITVLTSYDTRGGRA